MTGLQASFHFGQLIDRLADWLVIARFASTFYGLSLQALIKMAGNVALSIFNFVSYLQVVLGYNEDIQPLLHANEGLKSSVLAL